ncbi:Ferric cupric reductase transmembrane component 7 [Hyphodiscus hymeniophilus]|uniref:ferric-chelate reductase (NADPH) n=1 Tax=Hyphodiscus hymeniophilus TaxID=353542 RepID=A0A9P7B0F7_9HELO|nr:Ferric cupric reductase transmembrane component 7 [Hyphodiscus hymeniophilus]
MDMSSTTASMGSMTTSSAMGMGATGDPATANLTLSDPRCNSDACLAYMAAHTASQSEISWASQFEYAKYTTYYYVIFIFIFGLVYWSRRLGSNLVSYPEPKTTITQRMIAYWRSVMYKRLGIGMSLGVALFIGLGVLFLAIATFVQRPYYRARLGFGSSPLAVRSGMMALALTPIIVALSGKYNAVTLITGIGHEKLNVLHRYMGYAYLILSIIHTVPFIVKPLQDGGFKALHEAFYEPASQEYNGIPTLAMVVFLCLFSVPYIRHRFYELFAHLHIAGAIVYLGLIFWHCEQALDSWNYLWATLAIWLFSLFGRLIVKLKTPSLRGVDATVEDLDGEILKISIPAFEQMSWGPGQHVFLRFPTLAPLDNHPFTIASACDETYVTAKDGSTTRRPMVFYVKPKEGITRRLMRIAQQDDTGRKLKALIEGPYGGHDRQMELAYEHVILVAGGSGVTSVLPLLVDLSRKIGRERTVLKEIRLIWAVRNKHAIEWVRDQLQEALDAAPGAVTIVYYITSENGPSETSSLRINDIERGAQVVADEKIVLVHDKSHGFGEGKFGRPNLRDIIPMALQFERTWVVGCGPVGMNEDLSNAVALSQQRVLRGELQAVKLHTETFGW